MVEEISQSDWLYWDLNQPHEDGNFKLDQMFGTKPTQPGIKVVRSAHAWFCQDVITVIWNVFSKTLIFILK